MNLSRRLRTAARALLTVRLVLFAAGPFIEPVLLGHHAPEGPTVAAETTPESVPLHDASNCPACILLHGTIARTGAPPVLAALAFGATRVAAHSVRTPTGTQHTIARSRAPPSFTA